MMKNELLNILMEHNNNFVKGETLAQELGVSRQSIWKAINALKNDGYQIESERPLGYKLLTEAELTKASVAIIARLSRFFEAGIFLEEVDSTNRYAKQEVKDLNACLVVADKQSAGRGRLGRTWHSPAGTGLWFSLLLKPDLPSYAASMLTQVAAVAMHTAIVESCALNTQIKWPNDILYQGKKICGILTEMTSEIDALENVIIGIGVNVNQQKFTAEIDEIATSLYLITGQKISRLQLLDNFIADFIPLYKQFVKEQNLAFISERLNTLSSVVNKDVWLIVKGEKKPAKAMEINAKGELLVELDGQITAVYSGEVSVRNR